MRPNILNANHIIVKLPHGIYLPSVTPENFNLAKIVLISHVDYNVICSFVVFSFAVHINSAGFIQNKGNNIYIYIYIYITPLPICITHTHLNGAFCYSIFHHILLFHFNSSNFKYNLCVIKMCI